MWKRRKTEGFEWREYVRTTILVRRKERRQRVEDAKAAAVEGLKDVGRKGFEASAKSASQASESLAGGLAKASQVLTALARNTGPALRGLTARTALIAEDMRHKLRDGLVPLLGGPLAAVRRPGSLLALKAVAVGLLVLASLRALQFGLDQDAEAALWIAALASALYAVARLSDPDPATDVPSLRAKIGRVLAALPGVSALSDEARGGAALGLIGVALGGAVLWTNAPSMSGLTGAISGPTFTSSTTPASTNLEGRATALTGGTIKLAGETLLLDGIEAPEMDQICRRPGGSWRCGEAAKQELADRLRGKRISCARVGTTEEGVTRVRCGLGEEDLAQSLVARGVVFAANGFFATYGAAEAGAKERRLGLWAGDNERPGDYRSKRWDEAKRQAPEGCPIKGRVRSGNRVYVLPWSPSYDAVRINTAKGERWFCSEDEAIAAGWRKAASL